MSEKTPIKTLNGHLLVDTEARKMIADAVTIKSVKQTATSSSDGGTNTLTVTLSDGTTTPFNVKNGSKGADGAAGAAGPKGDKGDTGAAGPKGDKGDTGAAGANGVSPTVSVSKSGKVTTIAITDVTGTKTTTINDGADGASAGEETIPTYWQTHLDERVIDIREAMAAAGWDKSAFLWYNDAHWTYNYQKSPMLLKYLYENTAINKTIFGGDIVDNEGDDTTTMAYLWDWRNAIRDIPNHHSVVGNHDDGNSIDNRFTDAYIYNFLLAAEETSDVVRGGALYYYIDCPTEKTRYLYLDTATKDGNILNDSAQATWLKETLISTPANWHIIAVSHIWLNVNYDVTPPVATGFSMGGQICLDMFDAYNARTGDYANCAGKVEFCIGGHSHVDADYTSTGGIPVILTECDGRNVRGEFTCTAGTITEASVNAIIADYTNDVINVIRIGRGISRTVELDGSGSTEGGDEPGDNEDTGGEETSDYDLVAPTGNFTNLIDSATEADGVTVYNNGHGYKNDVRLSMSSYNDASATGWDTTGYIPVNRNDVIRFHNIEFMDMNNTGGEYKRNTVMFFNSDFSYNTASANWTSDNLPSTSWSPVYGDNGDIIQLTVPGAYGAGVAYMRVTAKNITGASIITVNEEINV